MNIDMPEVRDEILYHSPEDLSERMTFEENCLLALAKQPRYVSWLPEPITKSKGLTGTEWITAKKTMDLFEWGWLLRA